ncbi:MAG TPA: glycosyltransferase family 2 protein [Dehalococcoidia bacterium]|nr:glycosyltransferase family 2 protein [Dehalococcoidia bacterium]
MREVLPAQGNVARPPGSRRLVAVVPAYNEEGTVAQVLERLYPLVDRVVAVDDGSTDATRERLLAWAGDRDGVHLLLFDRNRGLSAAYRAAFRLLARLRERGELSDDDIVVTVDADGQHDPSDVVRLVAALEEGDYDAVIARRDLTGYSPLKRAGNWALSLWASLWAGHRLRDVESGLRAFRLGALLACQPYYRGWRYSETVELAVVLCRLGFRVLDGPRVAVPVRRSRTSIGDGLVDFLAIPLAWWRAWAGRGRPAGLPLLLCYVLPLLFLLGVAFVVFDLLWHPLFLGDDSVHHYAHIWFVGRYLAQHRSLPLHFPLLEGGQAMAFPYGLPVYVVGGLLHLALGDRAVGLMMALALVGTLAAAALLRPALRQPWPLALLLLNPFLVDAVYAFQLTTMWCAFFFLLWAWAVESGRRLLAAPLLWLAVASHPVVGMPAVAAYAAYAWLRRREALPAVLGSAAVAAPALVPVLWMTVHTPALSETPVGTVAASVADSLSRRLTVLVLPLVVGDVWPWLRQRYLPTLGAGLAVLGVGVALATGPVQVQPGVGSYYGALHGERHLYDQFLASDAFRPGAVYRVLEPNEREDGMYRLVQHGAVLAHEFYSESVQRRNWPSLTDYRCYLARKGADYVVVERDFQRQFHTNEAALLGELVGLGEARVAYADPADRFVVYGVSPVRATPSVEGECPD